MSKLVYEQGAQSERVDAVFQRLRQGFVEGRITLPEFEEQVEKLYSARSLAPRPGPGEGVWVHDASPARPATSRAVEVPAQALAYILVMAMLVGIWAMTGMGHFWPIWPAMGWGIGIARKGLGARHACSSPRHTHRG